MRILTRLYVLLVVIWISLCLLGCALFTKDNAKTVLDVAKVLCIIANATSDDATVQSICGVVEREVGPMKELLGETRAGNARAAKAGVCSPDAGASDAQPR